MQGQTTTEQGVFYSYQQHRAEALQLQAPQPYNAERGQGDDKKREKKKHPCIFNHLKKQEGLNGNTKSRRRVASLEGPASLVMWNGEGGGRTDMREDKEDNKVANMSQWQYIIQCRNWFSMKNTWWWSVYGGYKYEITTEIENPLSSFSWNICSLKCALRVFWQLSPLLSFLFLQQSGLCGSPTISLFWWKEGFFF